MDSKIGAEELIKKLRKKLKGANEKLEILGASNPQALQNEWLQLSSLDLSPKMLRTIVPYFVENVMDHVPSPELFSDFLYRTFKRGHYLSVISLGGIFKLIVRQNFDHPNFYTDVYQLISSNVCYSNYSHKFYDLVDLILSSTHVPVYVITAFIKKLSRVLLLAPIDCQLPLLRLIKNLLCRHETVHSLLINRQEPKTLESDPYDENELDLQKCGGNESSLWELKATQDHWHYKVAGKSCFLNHCNQTYEVGLNWQSNDEIFEELMKKTGAKLEMFLSDHAKLDENENHELEEEEKQILDSLSFEETIDKTEPVPNKRFKKNEEEEKFGLVAKIEGGLDFLGCESGALWTY